MSAENNNKTSPKEWLDEFEYMINQSEDAYITIYKGDGDYEYTESEDLDRLIRMARKGLKKE